MVVGNGNDATHFNVPEALFRRASKVLDEELEETGSNTLHLTDTAPVAFAEFLQWLYNGNCFVADSKEYYDHYHPGSKKFNIIVDLCILADKWHIPNLHNRCIKALARTGLSGFENGFEDLPSLSGRAYAATKPASPLRKFLAMMMNLDAIISNDEANCFHYIVSEYLAYDEDDVHWQAKCGDCYEELIRLAQHNVGRTSRQRSTFRSLPRSTS